MKLKFINLLLASVLLVGSAQVFSSCKDNDESINLKDKIITLEEKVKEDYATKALLYDELNKAKDQLRGEMNDAYQRLEDLIAAGDKNLADMIAAGDKRLEDLIAAGDQNLMDLIAAGDQNLQNQIDEITKNYATIAMLEEAVAALEADYTEKIQGVNDKFDAEVANLQVQLDVVKNIIENLEPRVQALEAFQKEWEPLLPEIQQKADEAYAKALANEAAIQLLDDKLGELAIKHDEDVAKLREEAEEYFKASVGYTIYMVSGLRAYVEESVLILNERINQNAENIANLQEQIEKIMPEIEKMRKEIIKIQDLENRVSSITLEGCDNDILGYLSTPFGIQSNILLAYVGKNSGAAIEFPSTEESVEYDNPETMPLTAANLKFIKDNCGLTTTTVASGARLINSKANNLGKVYFSVNPTNIDMTGKEFALVNSLGQNSPVVLKNVVPCTETVSFGYSRAANVAMYVADAYLSPNASLEGVQVTIDPALKDAVAQLINNKNATAVVATARAIAQQLDGILPALAVNCSWTETAGEQAVNSNFGVAAAVAQPLSFTTLAGKSFRTFDLPTLDLNKYKVHFDGQLITVDLSDLKFNVDYDDIELGIDLRCVISLAGDVEYNATVNVEGLAEPVEVVFTMGEEVGNVDDFVKYIQANLQESLNKQLEQKNIQINDAFANAIAEMKRRLEEGVNDLIAQAQTLIDETIDEVQQKIENKINGTIDKIQDRLDNSKLYDVVEKVWSHFNDVLDNPNHYMQPLLLYSAGNKYGFICQLKGAPTTFVLNGGSAATLVPTTHNFEVATPCYMKYVAVTNVWKSGQENNSAVNGDAKALQLLKAANAGTGMNTVLTGQRNKVALNLAGGAGYIYEITYQALDYHGRTSTAHYYVYVK